MWKESVRYMKRDEIWEKYPEASEYTELHRGTIPFIYMPHNDSLALGNPGESHYHLVDKPQYGNEIFSDRNVWGRYFPKLDGADIFDPDTNTDEEINSAFDSLNQHFPSKTGAIDEVERWPSGYHFNSSWAYNRRTGELINNLTHGPTYHYQMMENGLIPDTDDPNLLNDWGFGHIYSQVGRPSSYGLAFDSDFQPAANKLTEAEKEHIKNQFNELLQQKDSKSASISGVQHRMVWLSQPNNDSLKYWHHNPTNTTYTWDTEGTGNPHHWKIWDQLGAGKNPHHSSDWEGGFYTQSNGKHPADIWGVPSQIDYAPIQGDGDYGNSVW